MDKDKISRRSLMAMPIAVSVKPLAELNEAHAEVPFVSEKSEMEAVAVRYATMCADRFCASISSKIGDHFERKQQSVVRPNQAEWVVTHVAVFCLAGGAAAGGELNVELKRLRGGLYPNQNTFVSMRLTVPVTKFTNRVFFERSAVVHVGDY